MPSLNPRAEQLTHFTEAMPSGVPITMLNLLRFNEQAQYPAGSGHSPCTGRQAYARYSRIALARVQAAGGSVEFAAKAHAALLRLPMSDGMSWCWFAILPRKPFST